jgi:predicted RNA-binding Zn-ribbon protein involved in translation (DUF1610 family)
MAKFEDGYKRTWQATKNFQYLTGEWYDSRLEGNDIALLDLLGGIEFESQGITFIVPFVKYGSYKPDLWYACQPNHFHNIRTARKPKVIVEIKGWDKPENQWKRDFLADCVDDDSDEIVESYWQMRDDLGILGYDGKSKEWEPAAVYVCPTCGHTMYKVKTRHTCPYCGEKNTKFITDKANEKFNGYWKRITAECCRRLDELTANGQRAYYKDIADQVIAEFKHGLRPKNVRPNTPYQRELDPELEKVDFKALVKNAYTPEGKESNDD